MFERIQYHLLMHITIFIWGFTGILGKLIHLDSTIIVWYRLLIAAVGMAILVKWKNISWGFSDRKSLVYTLIIGCFVGLHWLTFYGSIQESTASFGILCLATTTLHVTWLEPLILKKPFSLLEFSFGLIVVVVVYLISGQDESVSQKALWMGLSSALFAGIFSVGNAKMAQTQSTIKISFFEMCIGFIMISGLALGQNKLNPEYLAMTWSDFWWLLFLGIICTTAAFVLIIEVVKRLGAFTVSLSINLEPVYTIFLAVIILKENELLTPQFYWGAVAIVIVVGANALIKALINRRNNRVIQKL